MVHVRLASVIRETAHLLFTTVCSLFCGKTSWGSEQKILGGRRCSGFCELCAEPKEEDTAT